MEALSSRIKFTPRARKDHGRVFQKAEIVPFRELLSGCSMEHEFSSERHRSQVTSRTGGRFSLPAAVQHAQVFIQGSAFPGASLLARMVKNLPAMQQTQETQV